jgi:hypothetical protein
MSLRNAASSRFIRVGVGIGVDIGIPILDPDIVSSDAVLRMTLNLNFKYFCLEIIANWRTTKTFVLIRNS